MVDMPIYVHEERHGPHPAYQAWQEARERAIPLDKLPVAAIRGPEWSGRLVIIHERDLAYLAGRELDLAARPPACPRTRRAGRGA